MIRKALLPGIGLGLVLMVLLISCVVVVQGVEPEAGPSVPRDLGQPTVRALQVPIRDAEAGTLGQPAVTTLTARASPAPAENEPVCAPNRGHGDQPAIHSNDAAEKRVLAHYMVWFRTPKAYGPGCTNPQARGGWGMWAMCNHQPDTITGPHGFRDIAAVHYPLLGVFDSADPRVIEYDLLQAMAAGVDTFVIDYYGRDDPGGIDFAAVRVLQQVEDMNTRYGTGFRVALMYDEGALRGLTGAARFAKAQSDFDYMLATYAPSPAYLWAGGKPVAFYFPYATESLTPAEFKTVSAGFTLVDKEFRDGYRPVVSGSYPWVQGSPWKDDCSDWGEAYLKWYYPTLNGWASGVTTPTIEVGGVWAGFDDFGVGTGWSCDGQHRCIDRQGGRTFDATWAILDQYNASAGRLGALPVNWVQLITLNDYQEGTTLAASVPITDADGRTHGYGYQYLRQTQQHALAFKGLHQGDVLALHVAQHVYNARLASGTISNSTLIEAALGAFHEGRYAAALALADQAAGIPVPAVVTAIHAGTSATVSWQDQPGATPVNGHRVYYGLKSGQYISSTVVPHGSSATLPGLLPDATYYVVVTALGATNPCETWYVSESWYSEEARILPSYALAIQSSGNGSGTVRTSPADPTFTSGTVVTLTAIPATSSWFSGWSGAVTGMTNPVTLTMTADKTVSATFLTHVLYLPLILR